MKHRGLLFFKALLLVLLSSGLASAQRATANWEGQGPGEADDVKNPEVSHPLEMFKGWTMLYKGYSKSPIIFDSIVDGKTRKYPTIGTGQQSRMTRREDSLTVLNLGVDDEITKANMAIYQPVYALEKDFSDDKFARDRHLDLSRSLRGIAILTLSYLDKTVAAGLATTQQQADQNTQNQLLKQIAWTSSKLANPQREALYNDMDEKIEACLISSGRPSTWGGSENVRRVVMPEPCVQCLDASRAIPTRGQGLFSYCVCCAEQASAVNKVTDQSDAFWSLLKRIFYGFKEPSASQGKASFVTKALNEATWLYGDVRMSSCPDRQVCDQKLEFINPDLNVSDKIKIFRDGPPEGCTAGTLACPITAVEITAGICPAIKSLMCLWPHTQRNDAIMRELWVQSSLGKLLTSSDIENMHIMLERLSGSLKDEPFCRPAYEIETDTRIPRGYNIKMDAWKPGGEFGRWLDGFCDAAAFSAFKKYHYRMSAVVEDHIAMNLKATDGEKRKVRELMGRVSSDINLAEADRGASDVSDRMVEGLNMSATRQKVTQVAAGAEALDGANGNRRMTGSIKSWSNFGTGQTPAVNSNIRYQAGP